MNVLASKRKEKEKIDGAPCVFMPFLSKPRQGWLPSGGDQSQVDITWRRTRRRDTFCILYENATVFEHLSVKDVDLGVTSNDKHHD